MKTESEKYLFKRIRFEMFDFGELLQFITLLHSKTFLFLLKDWDNPWDIRQYILNTRQIHLQFG